MSQTQLEGALLKIGFGRADTVFASGLRANNKLNLDYDTLSPHPAIYSQVLAQLVVMSEVYVPDFVVGVPSGATRIARDVAGKLRVQNPQLKKSTRGIDFATRANRQMMPDLKRGILIEDVINTRGTINQTLQIESLGPKIVAVLGIFDRGPEDFRQGVEAPVSSIVEHPIPIMVAANSELWQFASS